VWRTKSRGTAGLTILRTLLACANASAAPICSSANSLFRMVPPAYLSRRSTHVSGGLRFGEQVILEFSGQPVDRSSGSGHLFRAHATTRGASTSPGRCAAPSLIDGQQGLYDQVLTLTRYCVGFIYVRIIKNRKLLAVIKSQYKMAALCLGCHLDGTPEQE